VLAAYRSHYGTAMPVDIWTIHEQIVGGECCSLAVGIPLNVVPAEQHSYTCGTPTGPDDVNGSSRAHHSLRQWMSSTGYLNHAAVDLRVRRGPMVSDYGARRRSYGQYVKQTMSFLNSSTSITMGLSTDENRLVQRWLCTA